MINFKNYARFSFLGFLLIQCSFTFAQPSNDDPCNAIPLTVGSTCVFTAATNVSATNTAGVPAPGCASYNGQDVWFSAVVPASGVLNIDSNTGSMTDGGMAAYSGTCSSLSLIACDDDESANGLMPYLSLTGLTAGSTIFIRFWDFGGGTGTFSICTSTTPECGSSPPAGNTCATATPICDLNGYCGNTSGSYTANTWGALGAPLGCGFLGLSPCPGTGLTGVFCGSIENNSFLSFTASETSISFNVWVNSSTLGYGIQILIFSAVDCTGEITQYGPCYNPGVVEPGPVNITANGLTPGNTYYIMIDGNAGDICNYTIGADTGISIPVSVDPSSITICQGESVNITASGGDGTYTWDASPDLNTTAGSNVIATPSSSGTFNYTVNSATGNPLCPSSTLATAVVTVDDCGCGVSANNSGPICSGETADLTATTIVDVTYSWVGPNGFLSSDQNPINVAVPTTPGTYDYTVTATPMLGDPCVSVTTVTVHPNPTVDAGTYIDVCDTDADVILAGSPLGGTFSGTGVTGNNFDPSVGTQTITYDYVDGNGCEATSNTVITVNPSPSASAGNYAAVCINAADVSLAGTPSGGTFSGTGVTGNNFDPSVGTQTINYEYTELGCTVNATTSITVNSLPLVDAGIYSSICEDAADVALSGTPSGGTFSGTGVTGTNFNPSVGTQLITYEYTDANNCSATDNTTITVNALPTVDAGSYSIICETDATLALEGTPSGGTFSGIGVTGNNFDPFVGTQTITYNYTDANSCSNSDQTTINVTPQVILGVTSVDMICDTTLLWTAWNSFNPNPVLGTVDGTNVTVTHSSGDLTSTAQMFNGATFPPEYNVPTSSTAIRNDLAGLITFCFDSPVVNPQIALSSIGNSGTPVQVNTSDPYAVVWDGTAMTYLNDQSLIGEEGFTIISFPGTHTCISLDFLQGESYINIAIGIEDVNCSTDPVCEGGSVVLNASGTSNYSWSPATGLNSTTGSSVTANPTSTTTYTVVDANDVGCSIPASITVIVNPNPVADAGSYSAICSDANDIPLAGLPVGGTFTGTGVTGSIFDPSVGTQTITYNYTDINGCNDSDQTEIMVHPLPIINAGNDQTICIGSDVTLAGSGGNSYVWDNNGVDGVPFTPTEGTLTFTVTGMDVNGCTNTDQVTVTTLPTPVANASSNTNSGTAPLEVTFFNTSQFGSNYNWDFGNGSNTNTANLNNAFNTYTTAGEYEVILTASNGICEDTDTLYIIVIPVLGPEIHIPNVFTPNNDGANDVFFITATNAESVNVQIFNRWGEFMHEINSQLDYWDGRVANGNEANDGVYFFKYEIIGLNGEVFKGHGNVSLVR